MDAAARAAHRRHPDPDHLNPYLSEMDVSYDLSSLVYSYLVVADARGRLTGDLATLAPSLANGGISRDGRTYVYHLRRNVVWHDGVAFGARDVVASWRAVMNPANDTFEHEGYDRVASIDDPNPYTVVVHLRERYPPFVSRFFAPLQEGAKPVLPAHLLSAGGGFNTGLLSSHPVGTGPFTFVSWARGDRIVLKRFDRYFKGRPALARIDFRVVPSDQTIAAMLQEHQIDLIVAPETSLVDQYRATPGVFVGTAPWNSQASLVLNAHKPGLRDAAVRRAIAMAVPYAAILRDVTRGLDEPARNSLPPTAIGYEPLPSRGTDPATAANELQRSGWILGSDGVRARAGVRLEFTLATIAGFEQRRADRIARSVILARGRHRSDDQDVSVSHDFRRTERPGLQRPVRHRALQQHAQLGSRRLQLHRLRSLVSARAKHLPFLRSAPRWAGTLRTANRRSGAPRADLSPSEPADVVGGSLRSRLRSAPLDRAVGRSAKLRRQPDVDAVVERIAIRNG